MSSVIYFSLFSFLADQMQIITKVDEQCTTIPKQVATQAANPMPLKRKLFSSPAIEGMHFE